MMNISPDELPIPTPPESVGRVIYVLIDRVVATLLPNTLHHLGFHPLTLHHIDYMGVRGVVYYTRHDMDEALTRLKYLLALIGLTDRVEVEEVGRGDVEAQPPRPSEEEELYRIRSIERDEGGGPVEI